MSALSPNMPMANGPAMRPIIKPINCYEQTKNNGYADNDDIRDSNFYNKAVMIFRY